MMTIGRNLRGSSRLGTLVLVLILSLLVAACPRPLTPSLGSPDLTTASHEPDHVTGLVDFGGPRIQSQLDIDKDIMPGSTVSLIEVDSGRTVSTTRSDSDGKFILKYSNGFKPVPGKLYYFEAIKGLSSIDDKPNAVGADLARVRTIASFRPGGWVSLTSARLGFYMPITPMTTALSVVVSLRSATPRKIDASTLFGAVKLGGGLGGYPDQVDSPDPTLFTEDFVRRAYDLVVGSLEKRRDPLRWIQLSTADPRFDTVMLPELPFTISYLSPSRAIIGEEIDLVGSNFEGRAEVFFQRDGNQRIKAENPVVSPDLTRIRVRVPNLAVTGHIVLTLEGRELNGPIFRLDTRDGHSVVDERGNLYAVNQALGTVAIMEPAGEGGLTSVRTLASNLGEPAALTFGITGYESLYVAANGGTISKLTLSVPPPYDKVSKVEFADIATFATGGPSEPGGMAFRNRPGDAAHGALYLSDAKNSRLYVVPEGGGIARLMTLGGTALDKPRGLSFGPDGRLYVANSGSNSVLALTLNGIDGGTAVEVARGFSAPWGIAFNSHGDCLVSNFLGNSVYKVPLAGSIDQVPLTFGRVTAFASIPTPAGLDADASGYVYVADRMTNGVYRINSLQESKQIGFGMNTPTSTWADETGLYILTDTGRILRSDKLDGSGNLTIYAEGLLSARGLVRDSWGNFYTNQSNIQAVTLIDANGYSRQIITGLSTSKNSGLSIRNNKLYIRSDQSFDPGTPQVAYPGQGEVLEYTLSLDGQGRVLASGPTSRLRTPLDQWLGLGGTDDQNLITLNPRTKTFFKLAVSGDLNQSVGKRAVLTRLKSDPALVDPRDLWVDPSGKIWVADYSGSVTGSIRIYKPDGTFERVITDIENPTHLNYDGTYLYANSYTGNYLRAFNLTTFAKVSARERTGFTRPRGFAFSGSNLYVNDLNRIALVANYTSQATVTTLLAAGNANDIETDGSDILITSGRDVYQIYQEGGSWAQGGVPIHRYDNKNLTALSKVAGKIYAMDGVALVYDLSEDWYNAIASSLTAQYGNMGYSGIHGLPTGWGLVNGTNFVSYGLGDSAFSYVTETEINGSVHRSYRLPQNSFMGGLVDDGQGTVYLTHVNRGTLYRLQGNSLTTFLTGPYGAGDRMYGGISYYDGNLYQAIYTRHWVDRIAIGSKTRTSLKMGLVTPEL